MIAKFRPRNSEPLSVIAGPCQIESRDHALMMASSLKEICETLNMPFMFKSSFDKANRTSIKSARGIGLDESLRIFEEIRRDLEVSCITDIHESYQCSPVAEVVDALQIPAYLCRQTDLLVAAAKTGCTVNVKKGQFLAPWDMGPVVEKLRASGGKEIWVTERGSCFGYNTLVSDMRSVPLLKSKCDCPVIFDATHSVQEPGGRGESSGGMREFAPLLARCAVSLGVAAVFMETHQDPDNAPSDGPNMIRLEDMPTILSELQKFDDLAKDSHQIRELET